MPTEIPDHGGRLTFDVSDISTKPHPEYMVPAVVVQPSDEGPIFYFCYRNKSTGSLGKIEAFRMDYLTDERVASAAEHLGIQDVRQVRALVSRAVTPRVPSKECPPYIGVS